MSLQINGVALEFLGASAEEMVESDFKQGRGGSVGGNVPANAVVHAVGAHHHGQSVPANQALDPALDLLVAGKDGLLFKRDGVDIGSIRGEGVANPQGGGASAKTIKQNGRGFAAFLLQNCIEGFDPFLNFLGIYSRYFYVGVIPHGYLPLRPIGVQVQSIMPDYTQASKIAKAYLIRLTSQRGSLAAPGPDTSSGKRGCCIEETLVLQNDNILAGQANPAIAIRWFTRGVLPQRRPEISGGAG